MVVEENTVVRFHYELSEVTSDGNQFLEKSHADEAMAYLHGKSAIITGLEKEMQGKQSGDEFEVTVNPEDAYGDRDDAAKQRVPIKHLFQKKRLKPGMVVSVNTQDGPREVVIEKVGKFNVDVDTNHPLAGKTLHFKIKIEEVREATAEEIAHGHAHGPGPGGHHH